MPRQNQPAAPTPWQLAKPEIFAGLVEPMRLRGFERSGNRLLRHRRPFIDVVELRSKYGIGVWIKAGSVPIQLGIVEPTELDCVLRISSPAEFPIPNGPAGLERFILTELVPFVLRLADSWFARFESIGDAVQLLQTDLTSVATFNNPSPAFSQALALLQRLEPLDPSRTCSNCGAFSPNRDNPCACAVGFTSTCNPPNPDPDIEVWLEPPTDTSLAQAIQSLRMLAPDLREMPLSQLTQRLRESGRWSLGVHHPTDARGIQDRARVLGLRVRLRAV